MFLSLFFTLPVLFWFSFRGGGEVVCLFIWVIVVVLFVSFFVQLVLVLALFRNYLFAFFLGFCYFVGVLSLFFSVKERITSSKGKFCCS